MFPDKRVVLTVVVVAAAAASLAACSTAQRDSLDPTDPFAKQTSVETLGESLQREQSSPNGCLAPGNAGDKNDRCDSVRGLLTPDPLPEPAALPAPPPMPAPAPPPAGKGKPNNR